MSCTRKDFLATGVMTALAGCAGLQGARAGRFAMNASTLRGYNLTLLDQMKAMALSGFRGYEPWMKDIRAAKADGTLGDVCRIARDSGVSFINGIAFGQWVNPDPKIRAAGWKKFRKKLIILLPSARKRLNSAYSLQTEKSRSVLRTTTPSATTFSLTE